MKQIILIILIAVGGYFAYLHFIVSSDQDLSTGEKSSGAEHASFNDYLPIIPEECEEKSKTLADAIYGSDIGRVSVPQRNFATRKFISCLRDAGFSDSQINDSISAIKEDVKSLNPGSASGF